MNNGVNLDDSLIEEVDWSEMNKNMEIDETLLNENILPTDEEKIKVRNDLETVVESKPYLVFPSKDNLRRLVKIRNYGKLRKLFHSMREGSLRRNVLLMIRMTVGVGILTLPVYLMELGGLMGILFLMLAAFFSYTFYSFLVDVSNETGIYDFVLLINTLCSKPIQKIFRYTYFIDIFSMPIFITILSWNIFEYLMVFMGFARDDWFKDRDSFKFNEYHPQVLLIRLVYCVVIYLVMLPLMFKKDLGTLQKFGNLFLFFLLVLIVLIFAEMPFFEVHLKKMGKLQVQYFSKPPNFKWLYTFFSMMLSFYCQPYYFGIRNELAHPTKRRLKKVVGYSMSLVLVFFVLLAFICYICLGDLFTPQLVILRTAYEGKPQWSEILFHVGIMFFFIVNIVSMPLFNPPIRDYLMVEFKFAKTRRNYILFSTIPFFLVCVFCFAYPSIIGMFNFFGISVFNFNG